MQQGAWKESTAICFSPLQLFENICLVIEIHQWSSGNKIDMKYVNATVFPKWGALSTSLSVMHLSFLDWLRKEKYRCLIGH